MENTSATRPYAEPALKNSRAAQIAEKSAMVSTALAEGRMSLHFQPVFRAEDHQFIAFNESLLRLTMPNGDLRNAGQFVPQLEHIDIGRRLDHFALKETLVEMQCNPTLRLSVNMSALSIADSEWLAMLKHAARRTPDLCERLIIEITETAAMSDPEKTVKFKRSVAELGSRFALDDFGSGATCFRYLRDFRFDIIKIDGTFIRDLPHNPDNRILVESMVRISKHFEMFTVAEFVETQAEAECARLLGVDCLQGYHLGKPASRPLTKVAPRGIGMRKTG